jgi:hypothetical protein
VYSARASDSAGGSTSWDYATLTAGQTAFIPASDVEIRYQATNTVSPTRPTTAPTAAPTTASTISSASISPASRPLSPGDKVAIGLVVPLVIILLGIAVGLFLILRKRGLVAGSGDAEKEPSEAAIRSVSDSRPELRQELHG